MRIDKTLRGCVCPPGTHLVDVRCPPHFGDGYGHCSPHETDVGELRAAVAVCCDVGLCASCLEAHRRSVACYSGNHHGMMLGAALG